MSIIKLQSNDNVVYNADVKVAKLAGTIRTVMEDCGMEIGDDTVVPLPNVNSATLKRFLAWAEHHKDDPQPTGEGEKKNQNDCNISAWDADFLKVDQGTLFELILAANYLDAKALLDVACKTVANMLKGKTAQQIRQTFNITNDFTQAEEGIVSAENNWCNEAPADPIEE